MYNFYIAFVLYLNFCSSLSLSLSLSIYINKQGWVLFTGSLETELRQKYLFGPYILVVFNLVLKFLYLHFGSFCANMYSFRLIKK